MYNLLCFFLLEETEYEYSGSEEEDEDDKAVDPRCVYL